MLTCGGTGALGRGWQIERWAPKAIWVPIPGTSEHALLQQQRLCRCDGMKGLVWGAGPG